MIDSAERIALLRWTRSVRHRSEILCVRAVVLRGRARWLCETLARRSQSSVFCRPLALRGGGNGSNPARDGAAAGGFVCPVCRRPFELGESVLFLQTAPTHLDCAYPVAASTGPAVSCPAKGEILSMSLEIGQRISGWDHRCGTCGSTWRAVFISARCPVCSGRV